MARIVAYHPEILVRKDKEVFAIKLDLDDWYSDEDILQFLAEETGAKTLGELVEVLRKNNSSARIERIKVPRAGLAIRRWDEPLVRAVARG